MNPLRVKLPVCPKCKAISMIDAETFKGKVTCNGHGKKEHHKRTRMENREFVEVVKEGSE